MRYARTGIVTAAIALIFFWGSLAGCRVTTPIVTPESDRPAKGGYEQGEYTKGEKSSQGKDATAITKEVVSKDISSDGTEGGGNEKRVMQSGIQREAYKIGPGDMLHVSVWDNSELTMDVMVRPDGKISLPLLQDVSASGFSAEELRDIIAIRLKEFVIEPIVTITVKQVNYPKFFMMGEIRKPGTYPLRQRLTILQAISLAGGFTEFASTSNIILIRQRNPYQEKIRIDYSRLLKSGAEDENFHLEPGDTIIVP